METSYVELQGIPVLRVKADMKGKGPKAAFDLLESKLPTLKGRKFYGTFQFTPDGEDYYACVVRIDADDPEKMKLETGVSPRRMVRPQQAHGLGEEPLQATQSLRRNGPHSRRRPRASFAGVLSKSSRNAPLPPRPKSSPDRSNIDNTQSQRKMVWTIAHYANPMSFS